MKKNKKGIISPCVSVCRLSKDGICEGCGRTEKEIREWVIYSNKRRAEIMKRLPGA